MRTQIGDVEMFEKHVGHLIQAIPRDGSTVGLQGLFSGLSLDVATDLLFGESTNTLAPGFADADVTEFVDAYDYCLQALGGTSPTEEESGYMGLAWGFLGLFLPNPTLKQQIGVVNSTFGLSFRARLMHSQATLDPEVRLTLYRLCRQACRERHDQSRCTQVRIREGSNLPLCFPPRTRLPNIRHDQDPLRTP